MTALAADDILGEAIKAAWARATALEPGRGKVSQRDVQQMRESIQAVLAAQAAGLAAAPDAERASLEGLLATVLARSAAVAIAGGDEPTAERWLAAAEALTHDDDQRAEIKAGRASQERYRALVHGRNLVAHSLEPAARTLWTELVKANRTDGIGRAAAEELKAPRPLAGASPTLYRSTVSARASTAAAITGPTARTRRRTASRRSGSRCSRWRRIAFAAAAAATR